MLHKVVCLGDSMEILSYPYVRINRVTQGGVLVAHGKHRVIPVFELVVCEVFTQEDDISFTLHCLCYLPFLSSI